MGEIACLMSGTSLETNMPGTTPVSCGEPSAGVITFARIHEHADLIS